MNILIVDDDQMTVAALAKKLEEKKHKVIKSFDGVEALKLVTNEKVDLIISDVMMPCISGFTLLTMLKNFYFSKVPLILMSSYGEQNLVDKSYNLGAYTFITKPINYEELNKKIENIASQDIN